jgi:hypothetical protein
MDDIFYIEGVEGLQSKAGDHQEMSSILVGQ